MGQAVAQGLGRVRESYWYSMGRNFPKPRRRSLDRLDFFAPLGSANKINDLVGSGGPCNSGWAKIELICPAVLRGVPSAAHDGLRRPRRRGNEAKVEPRFGDDVQPAPRSGPTDAAT